MRTTTKTATTAATAMAAPNSWLRTLTLALVLGSAAACGGDEDDPLGGGHATVSGAALYRDGVRLPEPLVLIKGADMRLEVRFLDEHGEPIDGLRPNHDASLTFDPAFLATVTNVSDDGGFFFDLTVATSGGAAGVLHIGYGHHGATDEATFGPIEVVIGG
ncbi:MAG TPA: hypothetical protein VMN78_11430 [Longimicrobiales bacterium]|nr:hypothetical protein [Longimicrobiales bacterium]